MVLKKWACVTIILVLLVFLFSGCITEDKIVGTWMGEETGSQITFYENNTYYAEFITDTNFRIHKGTGSWKKEDTLYKVNDFNISYYPEDVIRIRKTSTVFNPQINQIITYEFDENFRKTTMEE